MFKCKTNLLAIGTIVTTSTFASHLVIAEENPFKMMELSSGYVVADSHGKSCKNKMKKMDVNNDGSVSKEEFMSHAEKKFSKKDKNGDGVLTKDEMKRKKGHEEGKCGEGKCGEEKSES